jgi:hypothetical protein
MRYANCSHSIIHMSLLRSFNRAFVVFYKHFALNGAERSATSNWQQRFWHLSLTPMPEGHKF